MKTIIQKLGLIFLTLAVILTPMACKKESYNDGTMTVGMTDAPAAYNAVNVDIVAMQVNHQKEGWVDVPINRGVYNLLDLQNNVSVVLANHANLPIGKINQMRLILGDSNSISDEAGTHALKIPSGSETGLKINIDALIMPNKDVEILLDFDANASIVLEGNGNFSLKPVIKIKSVIQN